MTGAGCRDVADSPPADAVAPPAWPAERPWAGDVTLCDPDWGDLYVATLHPDRRMTA